MLRKYFIWLIAIVYSYGSLPYDCRMASDRSPQTADKYILRFPDGMRDRIAEEAKKNNRSMNAEIVARIQASFEKQGTRLEDIPASIEVSEYAEKHGISEEAALQLLVMKGAGDTSHDVVYMVVESGASIQQVREALRVLERATSPDAHVAMSRVQKAAEK